MVRRPGSTPVLGPRALWRGSGLPAGGDVGEGGVALAVHGATGDGLLDHRGQAGGEDPPLRVAVAVDPLEEAVLPAQADAQAVALDAQRLGGWPARRSPIARTATTAVSPRARSPCAIPARPACAGDVSSMP